MLKFILPALAALTLAASPTLAAPKPTNSQKIAKAVKAFEPLAGSGVEIYTVKPNQSVKDSLLELSLQKGYSSDAEDFSWVGKEDSAWEADSTNFGETTMKQAYSYITELDPIFDENDDAQGKAEAVKNIARAKKAFPLLMKTGVTFGVAPFGAVQCGVTFAALAIIDPAKGKIYLFAKEGSGC